jgi:hypothetical protein
VEKLVALKSSSLNNAGASSQTEPHPIHSLSLATGICSSCSTQQNCQENANANPSEKKTHGIVKSIKELSNDSNLFVC